MRYNQLSVSALGQRAWMSATDRSIMKVTIYGVPCVIKAELLNLTWSLKFST